MTRPAHSGWAVLSRLLKTYTRPYAGQIAVAMFFMLLAAAATAGFAKLLQPVLDKAMIGVKEDPETIGVILPLGLAIMFSFIIRGVATYIHTTKMNKISQSIVADIQTDVFSHFMTLDLKFFHDNPSGHLVSRVTSDVNVMRAAVSDTMTGIGNNFLTLIFLLGVMLWQDWQLTLVSLTVFPIASILVYALGRRLRKVSRSIQAQTAHLMGVLTQIFQGIRQVKAFGMEDYERQKAGRAVWSVRELNIKSVRIGNLSTPINETLVGLVTCGIIVYGGYEIAKGDLTPGELISFIASFGLAYEPMKKLAKLNNSLQTGLGAAERVIEMLDKKPAILEASEPREVCLSLPELQFDNVHFSYLTEDGKALDGISFIAPPGKVTALVGSSGSGKSTILNLILRFYDVEQGSVSIDGIDIRELKISNLRREMALVSQDITIFDDTLAANIAYGTPGASMEQIEQAAKDAAAYDFITRLPGGFMTIVGENGVRLSGGQKQRLALARAILRNAPLLLLDEATSALDNESERLIQQTLREFEKNRTTIVIAHRLSTIQNADQILVLDHGRIAERGRHEELLALNGIYTRMYNSALLSSSD